MIPPPATTPASHTTRSPSGAAIQAEGSGTQYTNAATIAAEAAIAAAAEGKFWEFHDLLYRHQGSRERAVLEWYAERLGLDMDAFRAALDDRRFLSTVHGDAASAYALGIGATPTFIINGKAVRGALPFARFKEVIEERLAEARALVAKGVARAQVHAALVRDAEFVEKGQ